MIKTLLLICALGTPQADCSTATAEAVIQGPDAMSLVECGLHGQAYIANGAIAGHLDGQHYLKITCTAGERLRAPTIEMVQTARRGQHPVRDPLISGAAVRFSNAARQGSRAAVVRVAFAAPAGMICRITCRRS